jgi:carboxypeptidase T
VKKTIPTLMFLLSALLAAPTPAAAAEPNGFGYYHTYKEVKALIDNAVAAHPGIAKRFNIGRTYEGRKMWGIKISDNVAANEDEPEVFINAQIHARERASGELALATIGWLTNNYGGTDSLGQRVTDIVNSREIFIVPVMNPDGAEFDISGGNWHQWRKNRQPIPGSSAIGVDLKRQFGYMWGASGNVSDKPSSDFYRGPNAWYAPEVRHYRDFVNGRYQNGKQQIKVILSLHSAGRLVLWPYSYTKADVPPEMPQDDHDAFVALGRKLASLNGYKPEQGSDLYKVPGDQDDWAYHTWGIFTVTFEMKPGANRRYYPTQSELNADVANNRGAVLYLLEQADCAYREAGLAAGHC